MDIQNLVNEYVELAIAWGNAINQGDSKVANKIYRKLSRIVLKIEKERTLSESVFVPLIEHENPSVRYWSIIAAFKLGIDANYAEQLLQELVDDKSYGPLGSMAYITLDEWKKSKLKKDSLFG